MERSIEVNKYQNIEFRIGKAENLPIADGKADVIITILSLHFIDVDLFVKECRRVLKPGGIVLCYSHILSGIASTENGQLPAIVQQVEETNRKCLEIANKQLHPQRHVIDHYQTLFESIDWSNKRKVDTKVEADINLQSLQNYYLRVPFYARHGPQAENPMLQLFQSVKQIWSMESTDEKDIKIRATYDASVIILKLNENKD